MFYSRALSILFIPAALYRGFRGVKISLQYACACWKWCHQLVSQLGTFVSQYPTQIDVLENICINDTLIERVQESKVLGVTISCDLTWTVHVDHITKKAGKRVYILYQLKRARVAQRDLLKICLSVIRPVLEYASPAWSTCLPKYLSDNLEMV